MDPQGGSGKGGANRLGRDGAIIEVSWLAVGRNVLAKERVASFDWWDATKHFDLIPVAPR